MINKTLNFTGLIFIILLFLYTSINYNSLPERVPVHFDLYSNPDAWGYKKEIFILPIIILALWVFMYLLFKYYVKFENFRSSFENKTISKDAINFNRRFITILNFELSTLLSFMGIKDVYNATGGNIDIGIFQFVIILVVIFSTIILYLYMCYKHKYF
ncbi:DUF1648 domain-containing protein [Staphylococcus parequorum]|uniref:DUF1648 domain-containing protein n=1 Tax=unclassified Staphylococcus TaxID=91994 RepID=UPI003A8275A4